MVLEVITFIEGLTMSKFNAMVMNNLLDLTFATI